MTPANEVEMTWRNFAGGGEGVSTAIRHNFQVVHYVLTVSCLFYFTSVMSRSVSSARRPTNLLTLRETKPHHRGLMTPPPWVNDLYT